MTDILQELRNYEKWMTDGLHGKPSIGIDDIGAETFATAAVEIKRLRDENRRLSARFYKPSEVAQFMDGEQPDPSKRNSKDVQWIKTLRERSYCTLREAVHAHDMCAALSQNCDNGDTNV